MASVIHLNIAGQWHTPVIAAGSDDRPIVVRSPAEGAQFLVANDSASDLRGQALQACRLSMRGLFHPSLARALFVCAVQAMVDSNEKVPFVARSM